MEDINYEADDGLYAKLIKNRSFEFPQSLIGWKTFGQARVKETFSRPELWFSLPISER